MDKSQIISQIEGRVSRAKEKNYSLWTIGITDDPNTRKNQHDSDGKVVKHWINWSTDSEKDGRDIEGYFLDKGMKGDTGGGSLARYVYIF